MEKRTFRFYRDKTGIGRKAWYVDLPEWTGSKADLEMVLGADDFLEMVTGYSPAKRDVHLTISLTPFEVDTEPVKTKSHLLEKVADTPVTGGAIYHLEEWYGEKYNKEMWLCSVTEFIFGFMPDKIYIG